MANRSGASSLTALLAVAGMVGIGVVGFRAISGSPESASLTKVADTCPLMGEECTMGEKRSSCCPSEAKGCDEVKECGDKSACDSEAKSACKGLTDGCTGDGKNGCCGGCADGAAGCEGKTGCAEKAESCGEKAATCAEKAATCAEKATTCSGEAPTEIAGNR